MLKYFRWPSRQRKLHSRKILKLHLRMNLRYEKSHDVHRKTCIALDSVHCYSSFAMSIRSYFKPKDDLLDPEGSLSTCLPIGAKKEVEKAIVDKKPWQKAQSLHYSHGTLGYSKLFRTLPCSSQALSF